jgi:hypothetical protein
MASDQIRQEFFKLAVRPDGAKQIEQLVCAGNTSIDICDSWGTTLLHKAARHGCYDTIETLIRLGSTSINSQNYCKETPLHLAVLSGSVDTVRALIKLGAPVSVYNDHGDTPLHIAARNNYPSIVKELILVGGMSVDARSRGNETPMDIAASSGRAYVVEALIKLGSVVTPIGTAIIHNNGLVIETIVRLKGVQVLDKPLKISSAYARKYALTTFLSLGGTVDYIGEPKNIVLEEDKVLKVRYRVHFQESLVDRLLRCLDIHTIHCCSKI